MRARRRYSPLLGLLAALIALDVAVRVLEKMAVMGAGVAPAGFAWALLQQLWWWLALALAPLQLWIWMAILGRTDLSMAYAMSSLGYPLTMIVGWLAFHEPLGGQVWLGAALMTVGVAIISTEARTAARP